MLVCSSDMICPLPQNKQTHKKSREPAYVFMLNHGIFINYKSIIVPVRFIVSSVFLRFCISSITSTTKSSLQE